MAVSAAYTNTGGSLPPATLRAAPNWPENMNVTSSVSTPSLARKMFWKLLLDTSAPCTIWATVVFL